MMTFKNSDAIKVTGTCLQGYITATQKQLESVFGPITVYGSDDGKTTKEWFLSFTKDDEEIVATIYDWKTGGVGETETYDWHIGGHNRESVYCVTEYFEAHK